MLSLDTQNRSGTILLEVTWALASIGTILIILRLIIACKLLHNITLDSRLALVSWALAIAGQACLTQGVISGIGDHVWKFSAAELNNIYIYQYAATCLILFSAGVGRISVAALLLRVHRGPAHKPKRIFLLAVCITAALAGLTQFLVITIANSPASPYWNANQPGYTRYAEIPAKLGIFTGTCCAICDIVLAIYPTVTFWNLNISRNKRIGLCILLGGGMLAGIAAIVRIVFTRLAASTEDVTFAIAPLLTWTFAETWLILILGSTPTLRPLFQHVGHFFSTMGSWTGRSGPIDTDYGVQDSAVAGIVRPQQAHIRQSFRAWKSAPVGSSAAAELGFGDKMHNHGTGSRRACAKKPFEADKNVIITDERKPSESSSI